MKLSEFLSDGIITKLVETEKKDYISFFSTTYKDNLKAAYDNLEKHPRWAIVAGYYAMHDLAKLFLAKKFGLKINKRVHTAVIIALKELLKEKESSERVITFLEKAEEIFNTSIVRYLEKGKREREKVQYYTGKFDFNLLKTNASYFLHNIAEPFIKIMEGLIK